jgi:hypothetical protein
VDRLSGVLPPEELELHLANGRGASLDSVVDEALTHVPVGKNK